MWCPLPWTHLGVKNNGTLRMCSHSQSLGGGNTVLHHEGKSLTIEDLNIIDVMNCDTLKQVRRDMLSGEYPNQCKRCKVENQAGYRSRDQWETLRHINSYTKTMALENTLPDGTVTATQIQDMDLRVGNQCNLRCVMCFPGESTKWYKDYEEIIGEPTFNVDGKIYNLTLSDGNFDWSSNSQIVTALLNSSENLLKIKFGGGEPLMIKHHYDIIKGLIDRGYSHRIELEYSSNITVFPTALFDLWKNFKLIKICASLDGVGEVNEAIRFPTKWSVVKNNLEMLDNTAENVEVFTSTTISLLNLEHYADTLLWLKNQKYKKINKHTFNVSASHPVYNPKYLSIGILGIDEQREIFDILYKKSNDRTIIEKIKFYEKIINLLKIDQPNIYRQQFCERFYKFAQNQNQNWEEIFPCSAKLIRKWSNV